MEQNYYLLNKNKNNATITKGDMIEDDDDETKTDDNDDEKVVEGLVDNAYDIEATVKS